MVASRERTVSSSGSPRKASTTGPEVVSGGSKFTIASKSVNQPSETPRRILPALPASSTSSSSTSPRAAFTPTLYSAVPSESPLPVLPLLPPHIASLRGNLSRRRSSYPPARTPGTSNTADTFPWVFGGTPTSEINNSAEAFPGFGSELSLGMAWTPGAEWEGLLNFDLEKTGISTPDKILPGVEGQDPPAMASVKSDPCSESGNVSANKVGFLPPLASPSKIAQFGSDLAWRTILSSIVEVDGVGEIGVARVLQEVWKRGGGEVVTIQCLWPSIIIALSLPSDPLSPGVRIFTPSAQAVSALQNLYNLTLRSWEPVIFSGLLNSFIAAHPTPSQPAAPPASGLSTTLGGPSTVYGSSTPTTELDLSTWMNVTPGADWSSILDAGGSGLSPKFSNSNAGPGPSSLAFEIKDLSDKDNRRSSTARPDEVESTKGLGELIAAMEEGREAQELQLAQAALSAQIDPQLTALEALEGKSSDNPFNLPTPDTDTSDTPALTGTRTRSSASGSSASQTQSRKESFQLTPPSSEASPFTPATSNTSTYTIVPTTSKPSQGKANHTAVGKPAMQLTLPLAPFIPPPPMCMFFSPSFHDLQNGKVGVWKGDLEVRGRGGGKFSVLIVGEEATGYLWQSQAWPQTITYPSEPTPTESCTATMIPVSHLAREGFTPAAMGMVLCNDANITQYVAMVQGLHAEGVAFHLPTVAKLPIVFLPAKFNSSDPLQRLGIAYMTKPGFPLPLPPKPVAESSGASVSSKCKGGELSIEEPAPRRKRRRQSAPSKSSAPAIASAGSGNGHRRRGSLAPTFGGGRGEKTGEVILEEMG